ncbi:hypothetical protein Tco_0039106 [Tanacetum coccineum]
MCDVPLCNNPTSLEAFKEHSETIIDSNDDSTSSDDDSPYGENIDYVDASPPLMRSSDRNHEEFADELAHIISPPEYDHFCFKIEPELGNLTMDVVE